jgi:hypothetical protein
MKIKEFIKKKGDIIGVIFQLLFYVGLFYLGFHRNEKVSFGTLIFLLCIGISIPILIIYFLTKTIFE